MLSCRYFGRDDVQSNGATLPQVPSEERSKTEYAAVMNVLLTRTERKKEVAALRESLNAELFRCRETTVLKIFFETELGIFFICHCHCQQQ